jgi:hypothetical protein
MTVTDTLAPSNVINLDHYRRRLPKPVVPAAHLDPTPDEEPGSASLPSSSDLNWKLSQRGNPYAVVNEVFHIVLFRRSGAWAFRIEDLDTGQAWFSERRYETEDAARADALLAVGELRGKQPERLA